MTWRAPVSILMAILGLAIAPAAAMGPDKDRSMPGDWREPYITPKVIPYPADNPYTESKAELGRLLFNDPILSGPQTVSCSSCHNAEHAWGDGRARSIGVSNKPLALRAPTLFDVAFFDRFGWDGKFDDLESVAAGPMRSIDNMNSSEPQVIARLRAIPDYAARFTAAFGDPGIDLDRIEKALATYERAIVAVDAPFDHWIAGDETAINPSAKRGFEVFRQKGRCGECHRGFAFSDGAFHDIGIGQAQDIGRGRFFPTSIKLQYAFKTPTLRNVARRAPYMHDGSINTLEEVVDWYDRGGRDRPSRAEFIGPLKLDAGEKADLVAFLQTLTSPVTSEPAPILPR